jgi:hypothetical protein
MREAGTLTDVEGEEVDVGAGNVPHGIHALEATIDPALYSPCQHSDDFKVKVTFKEHEICLEI